MSRCAKVQGLRGSFGRSSGHRRRLFAVYALLVAGNVAAWTWALAVFGGDAKLLSLALLAYVFGLRHAVDADHIAAIDNVTRKLMQAGQRPVGVGLFFSLGHSTVVVAACVLIAAASSVMRDHLATFAQVGGIIGTVVSAGFLLLIAGMNLVIFFSVYRTTRRVKAGAAYDEDDLNRLLAKRGFFSRLLRSLFGLIRRSWHMYPLGFAFGLGFDTATEIGLISLAAASAAKGLAMTSVLVYPALFTAGMSLIDMADGTLMVGAYGWASIQPMRKLYYNMTITLLSVVVAAAVGGVEVMGLIGRQGDWLGSIGLAIRWVSGHLSSVGVVMVVLFALCWVIGVVRYRARGYAALPVEGGGE